MFEHAESRELAENIWQLRKMREPFTPKRQSCRRPIMRRTTMAQGDLEIRHGRENFCEGWGDFVTENVERMTADPPRNVDQFVREVLSPALV